MEGEAEDVVARQTIDALIATSAGAFGLNSVYHYCAGPILPATFEAPIRNAGHALTSVR